MFACEMNVSVFRGCRKQFIGLLYPPIGHFHRLAVLLYQHHLFLILISLQGSGQRFIVGEFIPNRNGRHLLVCARENLGARAFSTFPLPVRTNNIPLRPYSSGREILRRSGQITPSRLSYSSGRDLLRRSGQIKPSRLSYSSGRDLLRRSGQIAPSRLLIRPDHWSDE